MQAWIDEARMQAEAGEDGWTDQAMANDLDLEVESREEFEAMMDAEFDALHAHLEAQTRLQQEDDERIAALLATDAAQAALWPPF